MMAACRIASWGSPPIMSTRLGDCCCRIPLEMAPRLSVQCSSQSLVFSSRAEAAGRDESLLRLARGRAGSMVPTSWSRFRSASTGRLGSNHGGDSCLEIVASASSLSSGEVSVASQGEQRGELKAKLLATIEATDGNLNEQCVSIITELAKLNPNVGVLEGEEGRKLWVGAFEGVKASFKGSGKKRDVKSKVGYKGAPATLGRLSFNCFQPAALDVTLSDFLNDVYEEPQGGYLIITAFKFDNPRGTELPAVDGIIFTWASYKNVSPNTQEVVFQSSLMTPRFPERDLEVWKEVFAENANMNEQGQVSATLPDFKGTLDFLYIDEELRITKGNYGSHMVVRRLPEIPPEFRPTGAIS